MIAFKCISFPCIFHCHSISFSCFYWVLGFSFFSIQLSVGLRFSVQRLEDSGPEIHFELQIHRWHPPPTLMLPPKAFSLHTCKELFLGFVEIGPVSPDPITVCGHVKITAVIKKDRLPKGSAGSRRVWHKMLTVCFIALISKTQLMGQGKHFSSQLNIEKLFVVMVFTQTLLQTHINGFYSWEECRALQRYF